MVCRIATRNANPIVTGTNKEVVDRRGREPHPGQVHFTHAGRILPFAGPRADPETVSEVLIPDDVGRGCHLVEPAAGDEVGHQTGPPGLM